MNSIELALLSDSRLSREARLMGLYVASLGEGEHEVANDDFRRLLGRSLQGGTPKDRTLAGYASELVLHGWVEKNPGGRGSPRYVFTIPPEASKGNALLSSGSSTSLPEPSKDSVYYAPGDQQTARSSSREEVVVGEEETRAREHELDPKAAEVMNEPGPQGLPVLKGCRGALRDYLQARVPTRRQHAYVRTVQAWLAGGGGAPRGLSRVPNPTHILATALNDLGTEDELTFKSARGQVGVTSTLRTKVEVLIGMETRNGNQRGATGDGAAGQARQKPRSGPRPTTQRVRVIGRGGPDRDETGGGAVP